MPSLHFTWALLILWNVLPHSRVGRLLAVSFVLLTGLATIGLGEHYVVDLIVAVPFAFGVQSLCSRHRQNAIVAALVVLAWIFYFRWGICHFEPIPLLAWLATALTILLPVMLSYGAKRETSQLVLQSAYEPLEPICAMKTME